MKMNDPVSLIMKMNDPVSLIFDLSQTVMKGRVQYG